MLGPRRKKKVKPISTTRSYREIDEKKTSTFEEDDSMNIEEDKPSRPLRTFEDVYDDDDFHGLNFVEKSYHFETDSKKEEIPTPTNQIDDQEVKLEIDDEDDDFERWELEKLKASGIKLKNIKSNMQQQQYDQKMKPKKDYYSDAYNQQKHALPKRGMEPQDLDTIINNLKGDIESIKKSSLHLTKNIESLTDQIEKYKQLGVEIEEEISKAKKELETHVSNDSNKHGVEFSM